MTKKRTQKRTGGTLVFSAERAKAVSSASRSAAEVRVDNWDGGGDGGAAQGGRAASMRCCIFRAPAARRASRAPAARVDFLVKTLGVAVTDFRPEKLKKESLFSPLWLWRKFFLCLLNARANRFSKKIVKRLGVAALLSGVRRYDVVAVFSKARMIVWP